MKNKNVFVFMMITTAYLVFSESKSIDFSQPLPSSQYSASNPIQQNYIPLSMQEEYYSFVLKHYKATYWTQYVLSIIVFGIVVLLVIFGVFMSYRQFKNSSALPLNLTEIEGFGFKLKTSIMGLIILFFSLAFFYLYLKYVFPIQLTI